jgi:hypothetical protein
MIKHLLIVLTLVFSSFATLPAAERSEKKREKQEQRIPYQGEITAVDPKEKTFRFISKAGNERIFVVTHDTKISRDGRKESFKDITLGAYITGQYRPMEDGKMEALSVKIAQREHKTLAK